MRTKRRKANRSNRSCPIATKALDAAIQFHQSGRLVQAEQAYRRVLEAAPGSAQATYLLGIVTRQLDRPDEATALLQQAVSLKPDHAAALSELAKLYHEQGLLETCAETLRRLIALRPDLVDLHNNFGIVLRRLGKPEEAKDAYLKAIELSPNRAQTHYNLGRVHQELGQYSEASAAYRQAIALDPKMVDAHRCLVNALRNIGKLKAAGQAVKSWVRCDPDDPVACHMYSALCGQNPPARAADDYIKRVFNKFAPTYNEELRQLGYQGPQLIANALSAQFGGQNPQLAVLDAGCGTGLCGSVLRPFAQQLIGVDLSLKMAACARELNVYDDVVVAELTDYLKAQRNRYELIVAADTFNYFGALEELLIAAADALREAGVLIFTIEHIHASADAEGYRLNPHGRYGHTDGYIKRCAAQSNLTICASESVTLRMEKDQPVIGLVVRMQKG